MRRDKTKYPAAVAKIIKKAVDLFEGDRTAAMHWLQTRRPTLRGKRPLEFAMTESGAREVEDLIGRLQHGVFS